ncbi:hypothetical protein JXQ70_02500 [bacterium]|nr:hypothetical protein [bacterium]
MVKKSNTSRNFFVNVILCLSLGFIYLKPVIAADFYGGFDYEGRHADTSYFFTQIDWKQTEFEPQTGNYSFPGYEIFGPNHLLGMDVWGGLEHEVIGLSNVQNYHMIRANTCDRNSAADHIFENFKPAHIIGGIIVTIVLIGLYLTHGHGE